MVINCPVCGKLTCIHWPEHWIHRRGATYYCSDNCLQVDLVKDTKLLNSSLKRRKSKVKAIVNEEQRKHAVEIALSGGDPRPFLTDCGSKCPEKLWGSIKASVRENDPETFKKLPAKIRGAKPGPKPKAKIETPEDVTLADAMTGMANAAADFFGACEDMGLTLEKEKAVPAEDLETTAIRQRNLGEFYFDHDHNCIDWRNGLGDEISLSVSGWKLMVEMLPQILRALGVEL